MSEWIAVDEQPVPMTGGTALLWRPPWVTPMMGWRLENGDIEVFGPGPCEPSLGMIAAVIDNSVTHWRRLPEVPLLEKKEAKQ